MRLGPTTSLWRWLLGVVTAVIAVALGTVAESKSGWCPEVDRDWTAVEQEIFLSACATAFDEPAPSAFDQSKPKRLVSAEFIRSLVLDTKYKELMSRRGVVLSNVIVDGPLKLSGARIPGNITISNSQFLSDIDLSDAKISGSLSFVWSVLQGELWLTQGHIEGSLLIGEPPDGVPDTGKPRGSVLVKGIHGHGVRVGARVSIEGASIVDKIDFSQSQIGGSFSIVRTNVAVVELHSANFNNQLILVDNDFRSQRRPAADEALNLYLVRCKQTVFLNRSLFDREIYADSAVIEGDVIMLGTRAASFSAQGIRIQGSLHMGHHSIRKPRPGETEIPVWLPKSAFDLRSAVINAVHAPEHKDWWPGELRLTNFRMNSYVPDHCPPNISCAHGGRWFATWLSLDPDNERMLQRYQMVADILQARGDKDEVAAIGLVKGDVELRKDFEPPYLKFLARLAYRITVGYGYYPEWSVWWIVALTIVGSLVYRRTEQAKRRGNTIGLSYSFDLLVPLVKLNEENYKVQLRGFPRHYFYFHRLAGWVLGSFLIVALGGLSLAK